MSSLINLQWLLKIRWRHIFLCRHWVVYVYFWKVLLCVFVVCHCLICIHRVRWEQMGICFECGSLCCFQNVWRCAVKRAPLHVCLFENEKGWGTDKYIKGCSLRSRAADNPCLRFWQEVCPKWCAQTETLPNEIFWQLPVHAQVLRPPSLFLIKGLAFPEGLNIACHVLCQRFRLKLFYDVEWQSFTATRHWCVDFCFKNASWQLP